MTGPATIPVVLRGLIGSHWLAAVIFWGGLYTLFGGIAVGVALIAGLDSSIWVGATWWSQYLLLGGGAMVAGQLPRIYIGHGVTRRVYAWAGLAFGVIASVAFGALTELGFVAEHGVAAAWGAAPLSGAEDFVATWADVATSTLEFSLLHLAYFFVGWVIAATFQRGGVAGLLVIAPAIAPALLMEVVKVGDAPLRDLLGVVRLDDVPHAAVLLATFVLVAALALIGTRMLRTVSIAPK